MFEMSFVEGRARTHKGWTVIVSFVFQVGLIVTALLIPLIRPSLLPARLVAAIQLVAPPGPPPPPPPAAALAATARPVIRQVVAGQLVVPTRVPEHVALITDDFDQFAQAGPGVFVQGGVPGGTGAGLGGPGLSPSLLATPPPPPPVRTEPKAPPQIRRIEVGGNVIEAKLIRPAVQPVYPALARQARVQGTVVLAALIAPDGRVRNLRVLSGHPLLTQAALEAVRQWRYQPTFLNGDPMEVDTTVQVIFRLQ
ncbi:MAG TPA: energy transducer TonB [Bryobacteraceae bacterium]|nr:energy transducer TonB [Bryobacterales bacterium]HRJ19361.1 energy transducer TonB [Bryobacteraceae bacterium]